MRHPTSGLSEDDLSRLTGSSSSSGSCGSNNNNSISSSSTPSSVHKQHILNTEICDSMNGHQNHHHQNQQQQQQNLNSPERCKHISKSKSSSHHDQQQHQQQSPTHFSSSYLPELINPQEWQKSRKRKERVDSTSTTTQERKFQRSNSEELLPQEIPTISCSNELATKYTNENGSNNKVKGADSEAATAAATTAALSTVKAADAIRRVCSEDFQKSSSYAAYAKEFNDIFDTKNEATATRKQHKALSDENNAALANRQNQNQNQLETNTQRSSIWAIGQPTKDMSRRVRTETSPARSHRFSPVRGSNVSIGYKYRENNDDSESEHERRRSSERFCKTRAPPGRKASGVFKKSSGSNSSKYLSSKRSDENAYKYDLSTLKCERRGFVSKKGSSTSSQNNGDNISTTLPDHNDNNLIDFNSEKNNKSMTVKAASESPTRSTPQPTNYITAQEALPWERVGPEDQQPILSRRYGAVRNHPVDNFETEAKFAEVIPYSHQQLIHTPQLDDDDYADDNLDTIDVYRSLTSVENIRTRDLMPQVLPAIMSFQTPDERLKQVNKRLTSLKKKLARSEENFERRMGYRPSQAERLNDKYMKNVLAELSKLRKERHELKSDPVGAMGLKISGSTDAARKLKQIKSTLDEIEENLSDKRRDAKRSEDLDSLNAEQLLQEKTAVQHGLLYFEQLYGRPTSKEERDTARPLYTRYRLLKRMVSRSVIVSGGATELPTIPENEAFESLPQQYSSNNSTDTTNTPSDSLAPNLPSSDDSTTTTTTAGPPNTTQTTTKTTSQPSTSAANDVNENISDLNIEQLWERLDKTREEKSLLKRTIREYEAVFEEQNGRKMLKNDRRMIEDTYAQYKEKKAKTRLLQALIKKQISR